MKWYALVPTLCVSLLWLAFASSVAAQERVIPEVSSGIIGKNARVIFKWPEKVRFKTISKGSTVTVTFETPVSIDTGQLQAGIISHAERVSMDAGGTVLTLELKAPYKVKPFMSRLLTGLDLIYTEETAEALAKQAPVDAAPVTDAQVTGLPPVLPSTSSSSAAPAAAVSSGVAPFTVTTEVHDGYGRMVFSWDTPVRYRVRTESGRVMVDFDRQETPVLPLVSSEAREYFYSIASSTLNEALSYTIEIPADAEVKYSNAQHQVFVDVYADVANQDNTPPAVAQKSPVSVVPSREAPAVLPRSVKEEPVVASVFRDTPVPRVKPEAPPLAARKAVEVIASPAKVNTATVAASPVEEVEEVSSQELPAPVAENMSVRQFLNQVKGDKKSVSVTFPWEKPTAAALFNRMGYTWLVFDRLMYPELAGLAAELDVSSITQIPDKYNTILRMPSPVGMYASMERHDNDWQLNLSPKPEPYAALIPLEMTIAADAPASAFLSVMQASETVEVEDPLTGEEITVIPVPSPGNGVETPRRFVDFAVLESAQGIALQLYGRDTVARVKRNGVKIERESEGGLNLSNDLPEVDPAKLAADATTPSMLNYKRMRGPLDEPFSERLSYLNQKIANNLHQDTAAEWRQKRAELYLAEGFYREALADLNRLGEMNPEALRDSAVNMHRGAAFLMLGDLDNAMAALDDPQYDANDEVALWKQLVKVAEGRHVPELDMKSAMKDYMGQYPPDLSAPLMLMLAEQLVQQKSFAEAKGILDKVEVMETPVAMKKHAAFLRGKIAAEQRKSSQALHAWEPLMDDVNERRFRARAGFEVSELLLKKGKISKQEAIDRLDKLAVVWRGDEHEMHLLEKLGEYYIDEEQYAEGLRIWRDLITNFPDTQVSADTAQKMTDTFIHLFNRGGADNLPPLDALALYYEFRELTPIGEEGDKMIQNLADRLANVDLLDRAIALLTHQAKYRLKGVERSRIGARIALLHLLNKDPQAASDILDETEEKELPEGLMVTRKQLKAKALAELGKYEPALAIIAEDKSDNASILKVDILWDAGDWKRTSEYLEGVLNAREATPDTPLTTRESENILRLGLSYLFAGETDKLPELKKRFESLMAANSYKDAFQFITNDIEQIDHNNFERINDEINVFQSFMGEFRSEIQENGLSSVVE